MNPLSRTHYIGVAKILRNAELTTDQRKKLAKEFLKFFIPFTPCLDKKKFLEIATQELD